MTKRDRLREAIHGKLDLDDMQHKYAAGWRLVGLEWERDAKNTPEKPPSILRELPSGRPVPADRRRREEMEMKALETMMERIVHDISLRRMTEELNRAGFTSRGGKPWTAILVFRVFPELIEVTPEIFDRSPWQSHGRELGRVTRKWRPL